MVTFLWQLLYLTDVSIFPHSIPRISSAVSSALAGSKRWISILHGQFVYSKQKQPSGNGKIASQAELRFQPWLPGFQLRPLRPLWGVRPVHRQSGDTWVCHPVFRERSSIETCKDDHKLPIVATLMLALPGVLQQCLNLHISKYRRINPAKPYNTFSQSFIVS